MPETSLRVELATIMPVLLARVIAKTGLTESCVFLSQTPEIPYDTMADHIVRLRIEDHVFDQDLLTTSGRYDCRALVRMSLAVRTRLDIDQKPRDGSWLTHQTLGHLRLVHKVYQALVNFWPMDQQQNVLTVSPVITMSGDSPQRDRQQAGWGESTLTFGFVYVLDLDEPYR